MLVSTKMRNCVISNLYFEYKVSEVPEIIRNKTTDISNKSSLGFSPLSHTIWSFWQECPTKKKFHCHFSQFPWKTLIPLIVIQVSVATSWQLEFFNFTPTIWYHLTTYFSSFEHVCHYFPYFESHFFYRVLRQKLQYLFF